MSPWTMWRPGHQLADRADARDVLGDAGDPDVLLDHAAALDAAAGPDLAADLGAQRARLADGLEVVHRQPLALVHLHPLRVAGDDVGRALQAERLGAELEHLVGHVAVEPLDDRHHRDHRGDADQDAQHGQQRAQLVGPQRLHRDADRLTEEHGGPPRPSCAPRPSRSCRRGCGSCRCAWSAMSRSCVTRMIVWPFSCSFSKSFMISSPVAESRLPVGSSASRIDGSITSARAIATRWRWPPDSSFGLCVMRSVRSTRSIARLASSMRFSFGIARVDERQLDVVQRRRARQQVEGLEHEADLAVADRGELVVVHLRDDLAAQHVAALARRVEAADQVHQRRLARSGGAHHRDVLARLDLEAHAAQRVDLLGAHLVGAPEVLGVDDGPAAGLARDRGAGRRGAGHDFLPFCSVLMRASSFRFRSVL